ncbi:KMT2D methyltransferase, partial [Burhinus bistriatus]|nr:KMT2D methyltransferase [Burhinus bistriatus]
PHAVPLSRLASPDGSKPTDVPVPLPEPEPVGCNEEMQLGGNPKEAPLGDGRSPPGEPTPVEVPPSEASPDELLLNKPPPDIQPPPLEDPPPLVQPPEDPPPLVQPLEEPPPLMEAPPLMLPPNELPPDELPLERPSLDEPPLDRPPLEELPPTPNELPPDELPSNEPPLDELPPKEPLPSEPPPEEDPKPPGNKRRISGGPPCPPHPWHCSAGLLPEVAVAEEAPALALEVPSEEEMELEPEPLLPPETAPPPPAPPGRSGDVLGLGGVLAAVLEREGTSGSSPPLSEEDALEEGRAGGDPEAKASPLLLEPEELGPETPMEVCAAGEKLLQGDTSSSFPGSEPLLGSPDPEGGGSLSLELGPASADASLQKEDAGSLPLGAETDDSLLFEPAAKGDGDKSRRRSSPGRSRVKQGRSSSFPGRRRPRGGSHGGRGRGRARLKSTTSS